MARVPLLQRLLNHEGATTAHGATPNPTANRIALRDAAGRMQSANPAAALDVVNQQTLSTAVAGIKAATTTAQGLVRLATTDEINGLTGSGVVRAMNLPSALKSAVNQNSSSIFLRAGIRGGGSVETGAAKLTRTFGIIYSAEHIHEGRVQINLAQAVSNYLVIATTTKGDPSWRYIAWRYLTTTSLGFVSWKTEEVFRNTTIHFIVL